MLGQGRDFVREPADSEHGRLVPQNSHLVGAGLPGSFMDQRWGGVRKQRKKTIQSLQMSPRMASLRQGDVLVSLPDSHFMGGVKWNISCHVHKQRCCVCLRFWPPQMYISGPRR